MSDDQMSKGLIVDGTHSDVPVITNLLKPEGYLARPLCMDELVSPACPATLVRGGRAHQLRRPIALRPA
jgi:hypothetical protein